MIPQGWKEKTLGEVCIVERGSSPRPIKNFITDDGSGVNWIKIGDCSGKYVTSTAQKITEEGAKKSRHVKEGDFVISNSMSYGKPYILKIDGYIHDGWFVLRLNKNLVNADYFYYLLSSNYVKEQYDALATGAIVQNISSDLIKRVQFNLPALSEQERIVAKLDEAFEAIDKVKANAEQNLTNTKELFESYLNNIFSNINASFNKKLSDVTKIVGGGTPSKSTPTYYQGNIPWATVRDMNEDDLSKTEFSITNEAVKSSATNIIPANNVIIATRVGLGKVCILMQDTAINQDLKGIIPTKPMNFKYLFWWFKSIKNKIEEAGVGATVKGVKLPFVQNLQIPYISINDQQKIVEKLDALQEQTKRLEQIYTQKIKECDELKQSILQKAFRGEL